MATQQIFANVKDLLDDLEAPGGDVARMYQAIRDASDVVQKEIGWFIPVIETRYFNGRGMTQLFVDPPLLAVTSIVNDDDTLATTDYILNPNGRHWPSGPYSWLDVDPDATNLSVWMDENEGVAIAGRWGKFERTALLTATVADTTQQSDSQTTLKVSNAADIWPGMILKIGDEQELVTGYSTPTSAVTTLTPTQNISDETFTVANGALLNVGEVVRVGFEQMQLRDSQTNDFSLHRAFNRTARAEHVAATSVDVYRTFTVERGVNGTTAAAHLNGAAISVYQPPDDIRFLTRQIATLMLNKAKSGYSGRSGNAETGTIFYTDSFPRFEMERIRNLYHIPVTR